MHLIGYRFREAADGSGAALDDDALARLVARRADVDYESYAPGASTVLARLRWLGDGTAALSGRTGADEVAPGSGHADRVLAHLKGFARVQRERTESDRASFRRTPPTEGEHHTHLTFAEARAFVRDGEELRALLSFGTDIEFGAFPEDGGEFEVIARLSRHTDGTRFEDGAETEEVPRATVTAELADRWESFAQEAVERRRGMQGPGPTA